jgi:hypothetical protein
MAGIASSDMDPTVHRDESLPDLGLTVRGSVAPGSCPTWDPDLPPPDALDRSFAWLAEAANFDVGRSPTE